MLVTIAQCEAALRAHVGQVRHAAKELGITSQALYGRISRSKRLQAVLDDIPGLITEVSTKVVVRGVYQGDLPSAKLWLTHRAKAEGWSTRTEVTGPDNAPVQFGIEGKSDDEIISFYKKWKNET